MGAHDSKKYYWLKLHEDFFSSKRIKKLRKLGADFVIIYLKLQLLSLQNGGCLEFTGIEENFSDELALDIDEDPDKVQLTISYLQSCGLMECTDNNDYFLPYVEKLTGSETNAAARMREKRAKKSQNSEQIGTVFAPILTSCENLSQEIEKEKDIYKNICANEIAQECKSLSNSLSNEMFEEFWKAYPKKKSKDAAQRAFKKLKVDRKLLDQMLKAISIQKQSFNWQKDNGQFIPYPSTWLNAGSWKDEQDNVVVKSVEKPQKKVLSIADMERMANGE